MEGSFDYSQLDDMTLSQLKELKAEVSRRIVRAEAAAQEDAAWEVDYYVDEFGNDTESKYVRNIDFIEGKFGNSATTNSLCNVRIGVDSNGRVWLKLLEYGDQVVKGTFSKNPYYISILRSDGTKETQLSANLSKNGSQIWLSEEASRTVISALLDGAPISFYVLEAGDYASASYNFTVESTIGFEEAYRSIVSLS